MFGRKKKITQKFIARNDEEDNDENNQNEPKKKKIKMPLQIILKIILFFLEVIINFQNN